MTVKLMCLVRGQALENVFYTLTGNGLPTLLTPTATTVYDVILMYWPGRGPQTRRGQSWLLPWEFGVGTQSFPPRQELCVGPGKQERDADMLTCPRQKGSEKQSQRHSSYKFWSIPKAPWSLPWGS